MPVPVLVADDDGGVRKVVKRLLEKFGEFTVVGEAENGEEAVRLDQELKPEIILMDIAMPKVDGLEATRQIKALRPEAKVIIVTIHDEEAYRRLAKKWGADGFVLKKNLTADLRSAMGRFYAKGW